VAREPLALDELLRRDVARREKDERRDRLREQRAGREARLVPDDVSVLP
jgi:hypothetical protein